MHELSIAMSIADAAAEEVQRHAGSRVCAVHLRLGDLAGVVKEALLFSWDATCEGTTLAGSRLVIEDVRGADLEVAALEIEDE
jgi:hydrogenase nickel incorporation protein HypA/HybF